MKKILFFLLLVLQCIKLSSQDTTFIAKHLFSTPVRNVFEKDDDIYVKTGSGLYKLEEKQWNLQNMKFNKSYVFYEKGFFEADYLPNKYNYEAGQMAYLIPQKSINNASFALSENRLFVSAGGSLFEYEINKNYKHYYSDYSIRNIYIDDSLSVISSYAGIIINDSIISYNPKYASGYFQKIGNHFYLCSDPLFEYIKPDSFRKINSGANLFSGNSRKLIEFKGKIYSLNTKSLNVYDSTIELKPIHQGFEYHDAEVMGDQLFFCTASGQLFVYDGSTVREILNVSSRIRDIYIFKNTIYLASDKGVYTIQDTDVSTLKWIAKTPFCVMVVIDPLRNIWISTENGLFVMPDQRKQPILYIKDVEFNRGALVCYNDHIYAGSISGMYEIDAYHVIKNFLPQYLNKQLVNQSAQKNRWILIAAIVFLSLAILYYVFKQKRKKQEELVIPHKEMAPVLSLEAIEKAIKEHPLMTVEAMAEYYQTNTVQLNRLFKNFGTTPGKFMKTVKLNMANELLKQKMPMEAVAQKVGYSASFLKKELHS